MRYVGPVIVGCLVGGCAHAAPPLSAALFSPQLASDRSIVVGRVLSKVSDAHDFPVIVVEDTAGRPYRITVRSLTSYGPLMSGLRITAWCHGAGADLVADSVRVEPRQ